MTGGRWCRRVVGVWGGRPEPAYRGTPGARDLSPGFLQSLPLPQLEEEFVLAGVSTQALNNGRQNKSVCPARARRKSDELPARAMAAKGWSNKSLARRSRPRFGGLETPRVLTPKAETAAASNPSGLN